MIVCKRQTNAGLPEDRHPMKRNSDNLTPKQLEIIKNSYQKNFIHAEAWKEGNDLCLGIMVMNPEMQSPGPDEMVVTHTEKFIQDGEKCGFYSTDANGDLELRTYRTGKMRELLPSTLREILNAFNPKPTCVIITKKIIIPCCL